VKASEYKPYIKTELGYKETFEQKFQAKLIDDIDILEKVVARFSDNKKYPTVSFDTETTGLNFFKDKIVGFSFSYSPLHGFYVPIRHKQGKNIDPEVALKFIYDELLLKKNVLMYNAIFDSFMLWGEGLSPFPIKIFDVLALIYSVDSNLPLKGLKASSENFLGITPPTFKDTVMAKWIKDADVMEAEVKQHEQEIIEETQILKELKDEIERLKKDPSNMPLFDDCNAKETLEKKKEVLAVQQDIPIRLNKAIKDKNKLIQKYRKGNIRGLNWQDLDPKDGVYYASCDSAHTFGLYKLLLPKLLKDNEKHLKRDPDLKYSIKDVIKLDNSLVKAMLFYMHNPLYIDNQTMQDLCDHLQARKDELSGDIMEFFADDSVGEPVETPFNLDCLTYDTMVEIAFFGNTSKPLYMTVALFYLKEFWNLGFKPCINTPDGYKPIIAFKDTGLKKLMKIHFGHTVIKCSPNELFLVQTAEGWRFKKAKYLSEGDYVAGEHDLISAQELGIALTTRPVCV
jgi:hypothetical protein